MAVFRGLRTALARRPLIPLMFPVNPGKSRSIPEKNRRFPKRSSRETSPSTMQSAANRRPNECLRETRGSLRGAGPGSACPGAGRGSPGRGTGDAGQKSPMALFDVQTTGAGAIVAMAPRTERWAHARAGDPGAGDVLASAIEHIRGLAVQAEAKDVAAAGRMN